MQFLQFGVFEMDMLSNAVVPCPLLACPSKYKPDLEDLVADEKAREYWLECFENGLELVRSKHIRLSIFVSFSQLFYSKSWRGWAFEYYRFFANQ